uniref:Mitochondrial glutamate carrier 1 n=1 Tax=Parastrongyloides trichosuri TaxID=131310 RepID=A0A0N4ZSR8_PARTI
MTSHGNQQQFSYAPKILNGGIAGIVGVTCVFPIDLVKTRLQNQVTVVGQPPQYTGIFDCAKKLWKTSGNTTFTKIRSFYSGSAVNILLITPEKAIKLVANDFFRYQLASPGETRLAAWKGMIAGGLAGLCQIVVTTPMELLKIHGQQNTGPKLSSSALAMKLVKEHGIAGLYKGVTSTLARDVTFSVIYFPLFAALNDLAPRKKDGSGEAVFYGSFLAGITAGASASFCVTPLDVIKTRMQVIKEGSNEKPYKNIPDAFIKIFKNEGPKALFKGAACRMLVLAPLFGIAQTVYYLGIAEYILGIKRG